MASSLKPIEADKPDISKPPLIDKEEKKAELIIEIKLNKEGHQLEIAILGETSRLQRDSSLHRNEKGELSIVLNSKDKLTRPIVKFVDSDQVNVIAISSLATNKPLHYDVQEGHITANVSFSNLI